jgi:hypothetical protein
MTIFRLDKDGEINTAGFYSEPETAGTEIRLRWADANLRAEVERTLGDEQLRHFRAGPRALYATHVVSPNLWFRHVREHAARLNLPLIVFEYTADKFHTGNHTKLHLGRMRFFHGYGRQGGPRTTCWPVVDLHHSAGFRFNQMATTWGEPFVEFHHRLLRRVSPDVEHCDISGWIQASGSVEAFYEAFLSLCVCHAVLFENYRTDGTDREFTERVFMPAFARVQERFGVKPLIVPVEPVEGPVDIYWYSYPDSVQPLLRETEDETGG